MSESDTIRAAEIMADIRSGMTNDELMNKYRLSAKGLARAFRELGEARAVEPNECCQGSERSDDAIIVDEKRRLERNRVAAYMAIYERQDLEIRGLVRDITERGVGIKGIKAAQGETKTFLITPDEFVEVDPFQFEAICRWVLETPDGEYASGYEITDIGEKDLKELRKMIKLIG